MSITSAQVFDSAIDHDTEGVTVRVANSLEEAAGSGAYVVMTGSSRAVRPDEMTDEVRQRFAQGLRAAAERVLQQARDLQESRDGQ